MSKKQLFFAFSALFFATPMQAQITISSANIVTPGNTAYQAQDTTPDPSLMPGGTGSQTWNFSNLVNDYADTLIFVTPSTLLFNSMFPASTMGLRFGTRPQWAFLISNASTLSIDGQCGELINPGDTTIIDMNPDEKIIDLPANYLDEDTSFSWWVAVAPYTGSPGFDSIGIVEFEALYYIIDAYGNMTTPLGTFNTLRQSCFDITIDSIYLHSTGPIPPAGWYFAAEQGDTSLFFRWWSDDANSGGFPVVELGSDTLTLSPLWANWLLQTPAPTSAGAPLAQHEASAYPNPAKDILTIMLKDMNAQEIKIFDVTGKEVFSTAATGFYTRINTTQFDNGIYFYRITGKEGDLSSGKFVVNK